MFGYLAAYPVAYQQVCGAGGVEQEVGRERQHAGHRGAGQVGGMDEDHRRACVERGEQRVLAVLAQVGACDVGQQHDTVGVQVVERPDGLGDGFVEVRHREGGEEPEPVGLGGNHVGAVVVEVARQRGGVGGRSAGRWCRGPRPTGWRWRRRVRPWSATTPRDSSRGLPVRRPRRSRLAQHLSVIGRNHVVVGVDALHGRLP